MTHHRHKRPSDQIESILGHDVRTRRQICESSEEDLMDAYRSLLRTAKNGGSFEELVTSIAEFIEAFDDMDDDGARIDDTFTNLLRAQILSDDLQQQVAKVVHESLRKPHLDGRVLTESLEEIQSITDKTYTSVKISRSFKEAAGSLESFLDSLRAINAPMAHCVEEDIIQGILGTMKSSDFTKNIRSMVKALAKAQG